MFEILIISSLIGLSLGSFINVCVYRIPRNISIMRKSFCPFCEMPLRWLELIPVASFIIAGGKCSACGKRISILYPVTELIVPVFFAAILIKYSFSLFALRLSVFFLFMITVAMIDWSHLIIPNTIIAFGLTAGLIIGFIMGRDEFIYGIISSLLSFGTVFGIYVLGNYIFRKQAIGMGDVKLAALIGLFLGYKQFLIALWFAALFGAIYGLINSNSIKHQSVVPFGSFLALSSTTVLYFQQQIEYLLGQWLILNL